MTRTCWVCLRPARPARGVFLERLARGRTMCSGCGRFQVHCTCRRVEPLLVSPARVAVLLGVSRAEVYALIRRGELPVLRLHDKGRLRIPMGALRDLLGRLEQPYEPRTKARAEPFQ